MADSFELDPNDTKTFTVVWCSEDGTNDGGATDTGELQSATISSATVIIPASLTLEAANNNATTIQGVSYAINTVHNLTIKKSTTGSVGDSIAVVSRITPSAGAGAAGTWDKTITIVIKEN